MNLSLLARYLVEHYGKNWDEEFSLNGDVDSTEMKKLRSYIEHALDPFEQNVYANTPRYETIEDKINNLHPWYYPVTIQDITVVPGKGTRQEGSRLNERTAYRHKLLVDSVDYNFHLKSVLDIGSNCGYWSHQYFLKGAMYFDMIEGRRLYCQQAKLFWQNNTDCFFSIHHANVLDDELWHTLWQSGKRDFVLCAGILYHIEQWEELLVKALEITGEAILIDTRIADSDTKIEEPGGWHFDAIVETHIKCVPIYDRMIKIITDMGFSYKKLSIPDAIIPSDMLINDNYQTNKRVCLLCQI